MPKLLTDSDLEDLLWSYEGMYKFWWNNNTPGAYERLCGFCQAVYILELPIKQQMQEIRHKIEKESEKTK